MRREPDAASLGRLVQSEALRTQAVERIPPDPRRLAEGWEHRFTVDRVRAEEVAGLYRAVGFDVLLEPVRVEELSAGCRDCYLVSAVQFRTVYTRRGTS